MASFVKLDCGMLDSTTWFDKDARDLFITALLMATPREFRDPVPQLRHDSLEPTGWSAPPGWYGFVRAAGPALVSRAIVDMAAGIAALERLGAPEPSSRSQSFDGRRMIRIDGGWLILNYDRYRQRDQTAAERSKRYRETHAAERDDTASSQPVTRDDTVETDRHAPKTRNVTHVEEEVEVEERENSDAPARDHGSESGSTPTPSEVRPVKREISVGARRFMAAQSGSAPGLRPDVLQLHEAWKSSFRRTGATLRHATGDDAENLAEAIDAHGLEDCLLVAKEAPRDGMVNGTLDEQGAKHESIRYIFGKEETFSRILAAAKSKTTTPNGAPKKSNLEQFNELASAGRF